MAWRCNGYEVELVSESLRVRLTVFPLQRNNFRHLTAVDTTWHNLYCTQVVYTVSQKRVVEFLQ